MMSGWLRTSLFSCTMQRKGCPGKGRRSGLRYQNECAQDVTGFVRPETPVENLDGRLRSPADAVQQLLILMAKGGFLLVGH
jgi:hypothetical protein